MSSDDDVINDGNDNLEEEEQQEPQYTSDSLKDSCHYRILGHPPENHSPFSVLAKKPKWPPKLWKIGTLIYDVHDPSKNLPPAESPNDLTLRFESRFESGNLSKVYQLSAESYHCVLEYDRNPSGSCQWFYFLIRNARKDTKYTFYISGFHKGKSLYCSGARVFWYSRQQALKDGISWSRGGTNYSYQVTKRLKKKKKRASLQFQIKFPYNNDEICLCYALPYTYSDLLKSIEQWEKKAKPGYFIKDVLCETAGGRPCPLLTITNPDSCIPNDKKKCVFLTGRIHPGESNSSYLVHGILDFFLSDDPAAHYILDHCIVKCIPMINIDGVVEGFYRVSLSGNDLNRMWTSPDLVLHPVVNHTKNLIKQISTEREIAVYLDFHGHSRLHGTFMYGCPNDDDPELRDAEKTLPRVLSFLSDAFSWNHCVFSFPKERKAAGRIVVRTEVDVVHSFTIETSFGGVTAGPRAGCLYDEILWKELGSKCGGAVYHLLNGNDSPLVSYVGKEISFLAPRPLPLANNEERDEVQINFTDSEAVQPHPPPPKNGQNLFHMKQPTSYLNADINAISTNSNGINTPQWKQLQFVLV
ncbi:Clan MC, family M14, Zinc carboxypeptidase-like metallopeptidase [Tritrichomonas foetus]|uniref:Clan MC, family M14, Zinc carboxypeptidase-like metallopeptidase n=1 Tax=Tritrichomonas foetus TaxID=1144522 RepID=A0A1J4KW39_9EUKA|nr:Clan MC, family M14, Zinc carboxypeptidase-like metallopeptidase [Tritrichomonas foetus]|eukprot:OHT15537.1 Clan MC, family M14, Zinc carboxypeptidase-like metallopeptidase [Tritrichomonas foetus]